jgi:hypothetical protein
MDTERSEAGIEFGWISGHVFVFQSQSSAWKEHPGPLVCLCSVGWHAPCYQSLASMECYCSLSTYPF